MSSEELQGKVSNGIDRLEDAASGAIDEGAVRAKGEVRQFSGRIDEARRRAKATVHSTAKHARATASRAVDQAADTYETLRDNAQRLANTVDPMVKEQPYMAMAAGVVIGLVVGALLFGGGAKVIYIKPNRT
ncbi:MAG TPA: hypothetical protein VN694_00750 [Caulobacteraceae bacterium]|nr:hypothetical protein [Caulobacteraceae bacterium]